MPHESLYRLRETHMQPVDGASHIWKLREEPISLDQALDGHSGLFASVVACVQLPPGVEPELQVLRCATVTVSQGGNIPAPVLIDDEVWRRCGARPTIQVW